MLSYASGESEVVASLAPMCGIGLCEGQRLGDPHHVDGRGDDGALNVHVTEVSDERGALRPYQRKRLRDVRSHLFFCKIEPAFS